MKSWIPDHHLIYFIIDVVSELDMKSIDMANFFHTSASGKVRPKSSAGARPYDPRMMLGLLIYSSSLGIFSSRKIETATTIDIAFRILSGDQHPDHATIAAFRRTHLPYIKELFLQVLRIATRAKLVGFDHWALDGTKLSADASKHKAMSYERMKIDEAKIQLEIEDFLKKSEEIDAAEDKEFGADRHGPDVPAELKRRQTRVVKIHEIRLELEAEAAASRLRDVQEQVERAKENGNCTDADPRAEAYGKRADERLVEPTKKAEQTAAKVGAVGVPQEEIPVEQAMPTHDVPCTKDGDPTPSAQRNFTDSDSRIMKSGGDFIQGYNGQAVVDAKTQIIVACGLSNLAPDAPYGIPMMERGISNCGRSPVVTSMDTGYWSESTAESLEGMGIDAHIATKRDAHSEPTADPSPPKATSRKGLMRKKLQTDSGKKLYSRRKVIVEPVFGRIKDAIGFRRFTMRGIVAARAEWSFVCTIHNLLKVFVYGKGSARIPVAASA